MWPVSATSDGLARNVDDRAALAEADHRLRRIFRHEQRAARVDRDDLVEDGDVGVHRRGDFAAEAAAVDHAPKIEPFEARRGRSPPRSGRTTGCGSRSRWRACRAARRAAARDDVRARRAELTHGGTADAAARARDQDGALVEAGHVVASLLGCLVSCGRSRIGDETRKDGVGEDGTSVRQIVRLDPGRGPPAPGEPPAQCRPPRRPPGTQAPGVDALVADDDTMSGQDRLSLAQAGAEAVVVVGSDSMADDLRRKAEARDRGRASSRPWPHPLRARYSATASLMMSVT